jgi:hypothetical protein
MATNERPIVKPTNQARAGETGHRIRWVLGVGIAAVTIAFAGLWLGWFG